jgi:hypothetical protein
MTETDQHYGSRHRALDHLVDGYVQLGFRAYAGDYSIFVPEPNSYSINDRLVASVLELVLDQCRVDGASIRRGHIILSVKGGRGDQPPISGVPDTHAVIDELVNVGYQKPRKKEKKKKKKK